MFEIITLVRGERGSTKQVVSLNAKKRTSTYKYRCCHMITGCEETGCSFMAYIDDVYRLEVYIRVWQCFFEPMPRDAY